MANVTRRIQRNIIRGKLKKHKYNHVNKILKDAWHRYFTDDKVRSMLDK